MDIKKIHQIWIRSWKVNIRSPLGANDGQKHKRDDNEGQWSTKQTKEV